MRVNQACGVGTAALSAEDAVDLCGNDPAEIGNKVSTGSVNRFAPDSWPSAREESGTGEEEERQGGADRSRSEEARGSSRSDARVGSRSNIKSYLAPLYPEVALSSHPAGLSLIFLPAPSPCLSS